MSCGAGVGARGVRRVGKSAQRGVGAGLAGFVGLKEAGVAEHTPELIDFDRGVCKRHCVAGGSPLLSGRRAEAPPSSPRRCCPAVLPARPPRSRWSKSCRGRMFWATRRRDPPRKLPRRNSVRSGVLDRIPRQMLAEAARNSQQALRGLLWALAHPGRRLWPGEVLPPIRRQNLL